MYLAWLYDTTDSDEKSFLKEGGKRFLLQLLSCLHDMLYGAAFSSGIFYRDKLMRRDGNDKKKLHQQTMGTVEPCCFMKDTSSVPYGTHIVNESYSTYKHSGNWIFLERYVISTIFTYSIKTHIVNENYVQT